MKAMTNLANHWAEIAAIFGWALVIVTLLERKTTRARRRAHDLKLAKQALEAHYDAINAVAGDPDLPQSARVFLLSFAEVVSDPNECAEIVKSAKVEALEGRQRMAVPIWSGEIEGLKFRNPRLASNFHTAVASGVVAILLRWPEANASFRDLAQKFAADQRKENLFADLIAQSRGGSNNGDAGFGDGVAPA